MNRSEDESIPDSKNPEPKDQNKESNHNVLESDSKKTNTQKDKLNDSFSKINNRSTIASISESVAPSTSRLSYGYVSRFSPSYLSSSRNQKRKKSENLNGDLKNLNNENENEFKNFNEKEINEESFENQKSSESESESYFKRQKSNTHEEKNLELDSNCSKPIESVSEHVSEHADTESNKIRSKGGSNIKIESDSDSDELNVDLSCVKLAEPIKKKENNRETSFSNNINELNESDSEIKPTTSKKSNESSTETRKKSENSQSKSSKTQSVSVLSSNDPKYWKNIYKTEYFQQKSLNFNDIINRGFGYSGRFGHGNRILSKTKFNNQKSIYNKEIQSAREFIDKGMSSLNFVRRLKQSHSLNYHDGCVNALNFNRIGTILVSGSDDFQVCLWDWARNRVILTFDSGHKSNVFQTKFMPFTGDTQIVTCARDGQVRLGLISSSGSHIGTKKLAKHADSCHKIAIEYDSPNLFMSCGEDAVVYEIDLRQETPAKILTIKNHHKNYKLPLYSICSNPFDTYQFVVCGKDPYIRVYDKRMLVDDRSKILKMFSPHNLKDSPQANITSAVYNYNGQEIIASFSDDDIYLFETSQEQEKDAKYRFKGHRNSDTIKGVNFYGGSSDFIVSGSDDGRIFFWEKTTQQIVQVLKGDENGVVNVLEPHPSFPIIATSGLDSDIKIWSPTNEIENNLENLPEILKENQRVRNGSRHFSLSSFEFELLLLLMHNTDGETSNLMNRLNGRRNNTNLRFSIHNNRRNYVLNENDEANDNVNNENEYEENENEEDNSDEDEYDDEDDEEEDDENDDEDENSYNFYENSNEEDEFTQQSNDSRLSNFFRRRRQIISEEFFVNTNSNSETTNASGNQEEL